MCLFSLLVYLSVESNAESENAWRSHDIHREIADFLNVGRYFIFKIRKELQWVKEIKNILDGQTL